jgi:hypothetical protein
MPDITTLLIPDLILDPKVAAAISTIHPSRIENFTNTTTFTEVDPSFLPRPKDIQRARRQLEKRLNPPQPTKKKLNLQEKQALRKERAEKRARAPVVFERKELVPTRDPIDDALKHFLEGLTGEGQVMAGLVNRLKNDVKAGGRVMNISKELFSRLRMRRVGVDESGSGGKIVVEVVERGKQEAGSSDSDDE